MRFSARGLVRWRLNGSQTNLSMVCSIIVNIFGRSVESLGLQDVKRDSTEHNPGQGNA